MSIVHWFIHIWMMTYMRKDTYVFVFKDIGGALSWFGTYHFSRRVDYSSVEV